MVGTFLLAALVVAEGNAPAIEIPSAVIKIAEEVSVPATEPGVLGKVDVREGQIVEEGEVLAQILDSEVRLAVDRAKLETEIALKKVNNDVSVRFAKKSIEVARAELRRSLETNEKYPKTVSNSDLDRQKLIVEKGELEIKQAELDLEIAGLTRDIRENEYRTALDQLQRRRITAPLRGMVVEVHRRRGEWVQPGETVVRIVRLDRLRVDGFLPARHARLDLVGSKVRIHLVGAEGKPLEFPGEIVFVSPEVDPLNSQVRVWAEVRNPDLKLRPGMQTTVTLESR